ncbi:hypothetical protein [Citricoccus sp. NR2]|uniref:hypothetical protein n=1 Tax=Citricoccus sp. NR2 TaxID=3004095 RepID=UPI0022DD8E8E|nr:hypothetical protein [Citricoccus sp. NR2]WBL20270.1 hypothetical protein O1A05_06190 [Citricoccus sp. NR2]
MTKAEVGYPTAISDQSDEGLRAAIQWCSRHLAHGQQVTVWAKAKRDLTGNELVRAYTSRPGVRTAVERGGGLSVANGPVLAMWAHADDLGRIMTGRGITALCVVRWGHGLPIWAKETGAEVLHEPDFVPYWTRNSEVTELGAETVEALGHLTLVVNHANPVDSGYEKRDVIKALRGLHAAGHELDERAITEWAAANGWPGENSQRLGRLAREVAQGKNHRTW